ncbi:conjugal transfer protein TraO [Chryseobacterium populi]|uniref:Conjugative transposon protein TraO n=1 Tax=Chryseobacterium populi TaxID=1144316 RepID=J2T8F5_9FLAO|nr:conjugal transfer protein TraO [Chryseobacterium populi]EJL74377.1 Conjugative transposon protein TraO [Chryseobacterium populi]
MKKIFSILFVFALGFVTCNAQRQLQGQKGLELGAGIVSGEKALHDFFYTRLGITLNRAKGNYNFGAFEYMRKQHTFEGISIPVQSYMAEVGHSLYLLGDWRRTISLNMGLSAVGGYEVINNSENVLPSGAIIKNEDSFIYGGGLNVSLETYLGDKLVVLLRGHTKYLLGTSLERFRPGGGIGVRYIF